MSQFHNDSIFWVELEKIRPNPYQPRREFDPVKLNDLAESIRQYGVLQPVVVTRHEISKDDGGLSVMYELIAGERRVRAAKIAGLAQIPVLIRTSDESDQMKLELAIIENLQREDLNPVDRAKAFDRLVKEFHFKHTQIAQKIGKSREYVSNTIRLLALPEAMLQAIVDGEITEGHTRPMLMLSDRPQEQEVLFKEILQKRLSVRESESIARRVAQDRVRKKSDFQPELLALERELTEKLGTRVQIEPREVGGKIVIDYFSITDLRTILQSIEGEKGRAVVSSEEEQNVPTVVLETSTEEVSTETPPPDDQSEGDKQKIEEDIYSVKNFTV